MYQDECTPVLDEKLLCCRDLTNVYDPFAVKVIKAGSTVGHLPKKTSSTCSLFIIKGGEISWKCLIPTENTQEIWHKVASKYLV